MLKRRNFFKTFWAVLATGFSVLTTGQVFAKAEDHGGHKSSTRSQHQGHMGEAMTEYPPVAWADPKIPISPPLPLMGRQMGRVHTSL